MEDLNLISEGLAILLESVVVFFVIKWILDLFGLGADAINTNQEIKQYLHSIIHPVVSERHGDIIYFFDADTKKFIAQGRNDAELVSALKARWQDHIFIIGERHVMAGPDFEMTEITDPDTIGRMLAQRVLNR